MECIRALYESIFFPVIGSIGCIFMLIIAYGPPLYKKIISDFRPY
jgi:hypothetical protein